MDLFAHQVAVKAPDARIVVTGYPFLFEPPAADGHTPSSEIINKFRAATALLNDTIEQAVAAARDANVKIVYVDETAAFAGHGIGSSDPFINDPAPMHPVQYLFTRMRATLHICRCHRSQTAKRMVRQK